MAQMAPLPKFENGVDYSWQFTEKFNRRVIEFHDSDARRPKSQVAAKQLHTECINRLQAKLKQLQPGLFAGLIYTGSAYEGVKVGKSKDDDDLEFDIMVLLNVGSDIEMKLIEGQPGFAVFRASKPDMLTELFKKSTTVDHFLCTDKVMQRFGNLIQQCIESIENDAQKKENGKPPNSSGAPPESGGSQYNRDDDEVFQDDFINTFFKRMNENTKLRIHGPAIQLDVFHPSSPTMADDVYPATEKIKFYSVDIVPTIKWKGEAGNEFYVAKPFKRDSKILSSSYSWRRSFSLEEKKMFEGVDNNNACRRQVFRVLKAIRNREVGLSKLSSYFIKTVLFREMDFVADDSDWHLSKMGQRLIGVLRRLRNELSSACIEHYFVRGLNLLVVGTPVHPTNIKQMADRLRHLINSERQMYRILTTTERSARASSSRKFNRQRNVSSTTGRVDYSRDSFSGWRNRRYSNSVSTERGNV